MKFIAALCMLIDHIGLVFYPMDIRWRIIGRLAMPIFAYGVARGAFYTSSLERYIKKMLLFSFVSQIPFWGMRYFGIGGAFFSLHLNVGFTFLLALISILVLKSAGILFNKLIGVMGCLILADFLKCDYGSYGVLMVLMGYILYPQKANVIKVALMYLVLTILFYGQDMALCMLQSIGVVAYGIIYATRHLSEKRFGKFFYWFYPVHLFIIDCIRWWQVKG